MGNNPQNNTQNNTQNNAKMRTLARAAISTPPIATARATQIQSRMARLNLPSNFSTVKVLMSGRRLVLQGNVASEADEKLIARLLSLEPGVDEVESQLVYPGKPKASAAESVGERQANISTAEFVPPATER